MDTPKKIKHLRFLVHNQMQFEFSNRLMKLMSTYINNTEEGKRKGMWNAVCLLLLLN